MICQRLAIADVMLIESPVFKDDRGTFSVTYNAQHFSEIVGREVNFVQDNLSGSHKNVLRGLHYQIEQPQDKLVRVVSGSVFDVAVDLRRDSPTYGKWVGEILSAENGRQLWVPKGFGHGFVVLSDYAHFAYKVTDYWSPTGEHCIVWDDADLSIQWPISDSPIVSIKDKQGSSFKGAVSF
jgi:dTDP-4-dehydrorhamnose 3,5-epimerase